MDIGCVVFNMELNKVIHGDCLEVMQSIPDNSVDFILTDPPYGTNDEKGKCIKRKQDLTSFNVIEWDKEFPLIWIEDLHRIMKEDTWGIIFTDNMFISHLWDKLESCALKPRNTFYWIKTNKAPTPRANFKSNVETCIVFTKGRTNQKWNGGGNQDNYIFLPFVSGNEKEEHPTQKPKKLFNHFLKLFTNENDTVLDPFAGSGTTGIACLELNRNYILIEKEKKYIDIINERINNYKLQGKLF